MKTHISLSLVAILAATLASCAPTLQTLVTKKEPTCQDLILILAEREKEFQSVKGLVAVSIYPIHGSNHKINGVLSFEKNDRLRFQGFDSFGRTLLDLTEVNDEYQIVMGKDPPIRGSLNDIQGIWLRVGPGEKDLINGGEWVKTLNELRRGGNPVAGKDEVMLIEKETNEWVCYIMKIRGKEGILQKKIWLERNFYRPVREEIYEESLQGDRILTGSIIYQNSNEEKKSSWPDKIKVKLADGEFQMEFLEVNYLPVFPPDFFNVH